MQTTVFFFFVFFGEDVRKNKHQQRNPQQYASMIIAMTKHIDHTNLENSYRQAPVDNWSNVLLLDSISLPLTPPSFV
jgi:hypothetical protein